MLLTDSIQRVIMKKILTLLGIMVLSAGISMAAMEEDETSNIEVLRAQGYSESALRIMDNVKANNQGLNGNYKRHFTDKKKGAYTTLKLYVDPIQDDGDFGNHQVNFTNTWQGDETKYSLIEEEIEDL